MGNSTITITFREIFLNFQHELVRLSTLGAMAIDEA